MYNKFFISILLAIASIAMYSCKKDKTETQSKTFAVTFNSNGGSSVSGQTVAEGEKATEPTPPTKTGHTFGGWYTDNGTFEYKWAFTSQTVNKNTTLYAKWSVLSALSTERYETVPYRSSMVPSSLKSGDESAQPVFYDYDDEYNFYFFVLGHVRSVPLAYRPAVYYNGITPVTIGYSSSNVTQTSISNSITKASEYSFTEDHSTNYGNEIGFTGGIETKGFLKLFVKASFEASYKHSWGGSDGTSETNSRSFSDTYETSSSTAGEIRDEISVTVGNNGEPEGMYRYSLFSTTDVYFIVVTDRAKTHILEANVAFCARPTQYWELDYEPERGGPFGKTASGALLQIPNIVLSDLPKSGVEPILTTNTVTIVSSASATLGGNIENTGNPAYTERGVVYATRENPDITNNKMVDEEGTGTGNFTVNVTGLSDNTTYYVRAYVIQEEKPYYGEQVSFTTGVDLVVKTIPVTDILATSATLGGNIENPGTPAYTEKGVVYATTQDPTIADDIRVIEDPETGIFTVNVDDLTPNTTYYVRAYAIQEGIACYGKQEEFETLGIDLTLTTIPATNINSEYATLGGNIINPGIPAYTERGVFYGTLPNPTTNQTPVPFTGAAPTGSFSANVAGLTPNTQYYVRAYATQDGKTHYGEQVSFKTSVDPPELITNVATNVAITTATLVGNITDAGTPAYTERGVCYSTSPNPTIANNKMRDLGTGTGNFTVPVTGLTPGTMYYVRAYAIQEGKDYYGNQVSFTTDKTTINLATGMVTGTGSEWAWEGNSVLIVNNGANIIITTGRDINDKVINTSRRIVANGTANITLKDVKIEGLDKYQSSLLLNSGARLNLTIEGTNTLTAGGDCAGIQAPQGTYLTINGAGSLTATGGTYAAGIGGGYTQNCGNVTINGGKITAQGASGSGQYGAGAGIGGGGGGHDEGPSGNGGTITINGGEVTARGGNGSNGSSGGSIGNKIVVSDGGAGAGAGIGSGGGGGGSNNFGIVGIFGGKGSSGNISINGGTVVAYWGTAGSGGATYSFMNIVYTGGGGGGGRGAGIGGGGGGTGGAGNTSIAQAGDGYLGAYCGSGGSGGNGGNGAGGNAVSGGAGGNGGEGGTIVYDSSRQANGVDHVKISY